MNYTLVEQTIILFKIQETQIYCSIGFVDKHFMAKGDILQFKILTTIDHRFARLLKTVLL